MQRAKPLIHVFFVFLQDKSSGYVRGGCSPIGMKKLFPTWLDEMAIAFAQIYVNAGARGLQVHLAPNDLIRAVNAQTADLT